MNYPAFYGTNRQAFLQDMEHTCTEMVSVATNFMEQDPRTVLAGRLETETGNGYLIAVRISNDTPPELLSAAIDLYHAIQYHYRHSIDEEGQADAP